MSSSEPFNFGRKIKELKKLHKKGYADLTAGLKISRERIIALEEGEREPTEVERQRFAAFYSMPVEDFQPRQVSVPAPRPAVPSNPAPVPQQRPVVTNPAPRPSAPSNPTPRPAPAPRPAAKQGNDQGDIKDVSPNDPKPVMKYTAEQLGDIESAYLRKQRDLKVPLTFTFLNGKEYTGVVVDFTPFTIHIIEEATKEEVILRKLAVAYYRKSDALTEKETEKGS